MRLRCQRADKLAPGHGKEKSSRDNVSIHDFDGGLFAMDNIVMLDVNDLNTLRVEKL